LQLGATCILIPHECEKHKERFEKEYQRVKARQERENQA